MFKLEDRNTRFYPVEVPMKDDEGRERKFKFDGEFNILTQDEAEELLKVNSTEVVRDAVICDRVFAGWRKVQGPDDRDLAINDENKTKLLNVLGMRGAIVRAWMKSAGLEGLLKN